MLKKDLCNENQEIRFRTVSCINDNFIVRKVTMCQFDNSLKPRPTLSNFFVKKSEHALLVLLVRGSFNI